MGFKRVFFISESQKIEHTVNMIGKTSLSFVDKLSKTMVSAIAVLIKNNVMSNRYVKIL